MGMLVRPWVCEHARVAGASAADARVVRVHLSGQPERDEEACALIVTDDAADGAAVRRNRLLHAADHPVGQAEVVHLKSVKGGHVGG